MTGWGSRTLAIELAGETFSIGGLGDAQVRSLETRYRDRLRHDNAERGATVAVHRDVFPDRDTRGWEYEVDLAWSGNGFALEGLHVRARVDGDRGDVWTSAGGEAEFWGVLENVLRPWLAWRLLSSGGLLVHSACVGGFLFPGRSGAGKSTIARLGREAGLPVLSDDLNALRVTEGQWTALPLPFTGDLQEHELSRSAAEVRALVALEHGSAESVRDLGAAEAAALLVRCSPYVNLDPHRAALLLERAGSIAASVPRAVLTFRRQGRVWPILQPLSCSRPTLE